MSEYMKIKIVGSEEGAIIVPRYSPIIDFSENYRHLCKYPILLAKVNNEIQELGRQIFEDSEIEFLDITDTQGFRAYQRGVVFMMICATKEILGVETRVVVEHSVNKNYYCEIVGEEITDKLIGKIERRMNEMVSENNAIEKHSLPVGESVRLSKEFGLEDKVKILKYRRTANVNFYRLRWFFDYFYGAMPPNTECLPKFKLCKRFNGFFLQFPDPSNPDEFSELKNLTKMSQVFKESSQFAKILKVDTVGALNDEISIGRLGDIMRIAEALHEKKLANIADQIDQQNKTVVLIAGPSSSGKTTFAERLCVQLRVNGLRPHVISLDNYYLDRKDIPLDAEGKHDFECLESLDVKQVNDDLLQLIQGETVELPEYNFLTGTREYKGRRLRLTDGDVLVFEGIHGLNEKLTASVPKKDKFKIFISALTQLNIDDHNRIPTTDTRLIRRIVRDNRYRGASAERTISMWPSVQRGESNYIFPFQEEADAFFNSALVYEMCVLKQFIEPLLFAITKDKEEYPEAKRLIKFLDSFLGVSSEQVPKNSILREFIGGSCFNT